MSHSANGKHTPSTLGNGRKNLFPLSSGQLILQLHIFLANDVCTSLKGWPKSPPKSKTWNFQDETKIFGYTSPGNPRTPWVGSFISKLTFCIASQFLGPSKKSGSKRHRKTENTFFTPTSPKNRGIDICFFCLPLCGRVMG